MKCPRCQGAITAAPDAAGLVVCSSCGARLRARPAGSAAPPPAGSSSPSPSSSPPPGRAAKADVAPRQSDAAPPATATTAPRRVEDPAPPTPAPPDGPRGAGDTAEGVVLEKIATLMEEIRAIRSVQDEILALLQETSRPAGPAAPSLDESFGFGGVDPDDRPPSAPAPVVRARRRKTVLLIDDDEQTRKATTIALEQAEVPVRVVSDGNGALAAIAKEKPDVIVMELGIGGSMAGKDVINMIKATMEWVDIPIVLYTRLPIESQKEARTIHGADELVPKDSGPANLVSRVITIFRKG